MGSIAVLAALGRRLNREAGAGPIPSLYFFTDPKRTPDPLAIAARLPRGAAVVFRHFGRADRVRVAEKLAALCRERRLVLLIAADPALARQVRADGVHWPEQRAPKTRRGGGLQTMAAHSRRALLRAQAAGYDAAILAPVFESRSPSAEAPLGLSRATRLVHGVGAPVIALGGITPKTARLLTGHGFAGLAAVDALK